MTRVFVFSMVLFLLPFVVTAQANKHEFGNCFGKANKKSINIKMENLLAKISEETGCAKDKLSYTVDEFYTTFYSKPCRHLPKKITFNVCGEKRTYQHKGLSGNITNWLLGSWELAKSK